MPYTATDGIVHILNNFTLKKVKQHTTIIPYDNTRSIETPLLKVVQGLTHSLLLYIQLAMKHDQEEHRIAGIVLGSAVA